MSQVTSYPDFYQKINQVAQQTVAAIRAETRWVVDEWDHPMQFVRKAVDGIATDDTAEAIISAVSEEDWIYVVGECVDVTGTFPQQRAEQARVVLEELVYRRVDTDNPEVHQIAHDGAAQQR